MKRRRSDGTVWAWGANPGNGTNHASDVPAQVSKLTSVWRIAAGWSHSLALKSDGTVWAWGWNDYGQVGNGSKITTNVPVRVTNLSNAVAVAGGDFHSLALKNDGTVWAWGGNGVGQLGNGTYIDSNMAVRVRDLIGIVAIAAGRNHSLALKSDGTVWAWGFNNEGTLGNGTSGGTSAAPVRVSNLTDVVATAGVGYDHSLALKSDGTVWAWGTNAYGQLGNGTDSEFSAVPVKVSVLKGVVAIGGGAWHSLAVKSDGTAWGWGNNQGGQLGNGTNGDTTTVPVRLGNLTGMLAAGGGWMHSVALKKDGTVWALGENYVGEMGVPSYNAKHTPIRVRNLAGAVAMAGGAYHSLALKADGTVRAWGGNHDGQLGGAPDKSSSSVPVKVRNLTGVAAIDAGWEHSLALKSNGTVWAWGDNYYGQLGNGTTTDSDVPVQVSSLGNVVAIAGGGGYYDDEFYFYTWGQSVALEDDGSVWARGDNEFGQLGNGTKTGSSVPVRVKNLSGVVGISAGNSHTMALRSEGRVWAWGSNEFGQLGNGTIDSSNVPVRVSSLTEVIAIACGGYHSLALKSDGTVWAWGYNQSGQLGNNTNISSQAPVLVSNLTGVVAIAAGGEHSFALKSDGTLWAWGDNDYVGQLGNDGADDSYVPVQVSNLTGVVAIAAGNLHSLAVRADEIPQATLDSVSVSFGNQDVGTASTPRTITLSNSGQASMSITTVTLLGVNADDFTITADNCSSSTVPAGSACTIKVKFTPAAAGSRSAAVLMTTIAPLSPHIVLLGGAGIP